LRKPASSYPLALSLSSKKKLKLLLVRDERQSFERVGIVRIQPQPQAIVYADLAAALENLGRFDEALAAQQKAVAQDPYNPVLQKTLILMFIHRKQYTDAQSSLIHYLDTFPQDSFMRRMLALAQGQTPK
jgi:predicted Zn-dependent protease